MEIGRDERLDGVPGRQPGASVEDPDPERRQREGLRAGAAGALVRPQRDIDLAAGRRSTTRTPVSSPARSATSAAAPSLLCSMLYGFRQVATSTPFGGMFSSLSATAAARSPRPASLDTTTIRVTVWRSK